MREAPAMAADDVPSAGQCPAVPFEPAPRHARSRAIFRFRAYPVASTRCGETSGRAGWPRLHAAPDPVCLHVRHHGDDGFRLHRWLAVAPAGVGAVAGGHVRHGQRGAVDADVAGLGQAQRPPGPPGRDAHRLCRLLRELLRHEWLAGGGHARADECRAGLCRAGADARCHRRLLCGGAHGQPGADRRQPAARAACGRDGIAGRGQWSGSGAGACTGGAAHALRAGGSALSDGAAAGTGTGGAVEVPAGHAAGRRTSGTVAAPAGSEVAPPDGGGVHGAVHGGRGSDRRGLLCHRPIGHDARGRGAGGRHGTDHRGRGADHHADGRAAGHVATGPDDLHRHDHGRHRLRIGAAGHRRADAHAVLLRCSGGHGLRVPGLHGHGGQCGAAARAGGGGRFGRGGPRAGQCAGAAGRCAAL